MRVQSSRHGILLGRLGRVVSPARLLVPLLPAITHLREQRFSVLVLPEGERRATVVALHLVEVISLADTVARADVRALTEAALLLAQDTVLTEYFHGVLDAIDVGRHGRVRIDPK